MLIRLLQLFPLVATAKRALGHAILQPSVETWELSTGVQVVALSVSEVRVGSTDDVPKLSSEEVLAEVADVVWFV